MTLRRRGSSCAAVVALLLLLLCPAVVSAQDPPRPPVRDTLRPQPDTIPRAEPRDTLPAVDPEVEDSAPPAMRFPAMPLSPHVDAAGTEWVWDRELLLREADISLIDALERIPGITTFRAGTFAQPEAASLFGGTAARIEIEIDGYVLDPLAAATFDLAQLTLGQLRELRVQRRLGLLRIVMLTEFPESGRPFTRVEAGIGVPAANMFRGMFLIPEVLAGPLALGIERIDTDGINRREPAGLFAGWAKWAWTNGTRGVQLEFMRNTLRREDGSPWPTDRVRQDIVLRARNRFAEGLVAEAYVGRGQLDETTPAAAEEETLRLERESVQAGARAAWESPVAGVVAAFRYRSHDALPTLEATLEADVRAGPLRAGVLGGTMSLDDAWTRPFATLRAEAGPLFGFSAFGEITRGQRLAPAFGEGESALVSDRSGWRAGVSLDLGRASGSVSAIRLDGATSHPFGLPFDSSAGGIVAEAADGLEAHGRVILWPGVLSLSSWITDWRNATGWAYLPSRSWRTALELHWIPLPSGNLEIFGRAEAHMRGSTLVYDSDPEAASPVVTLPSFTTGDAYLQIRIIDVRIFVRWEDILGIDIEELPGRMYRGPRIFYGVKWDLWN